MKNNLEIFTNYYQKKKKIIDEELHNFNNKLLEENNSLIKENLNYFTELNTNGKNIRGLLVLLGYELLKDDSDYAIDLALAYEVFQTAIIVHDDIIDQDDIRRGKYTITYQNKRKYSSLENSNRNHLSNSIALCIGDYGLYLANTIISDSYQEDNNLGKILSCFNQIVLDTIKGEILEVTLPYENQTDEDLENNIYNIYLLKTAIYTISGPLSLGLLLAGADNKKIEEIRIFGEKIGIAFQIQDDILGIFSNEVEKNLATDIKENKKTLLYQEVMKTKYKEEFLNYCGKKDFNEKDIENIKEILIKSKAKENCEKKMNELYEEGEKILENISWISIDNKRLLLGFIEMLKQRKK